MWLFRIPELLSYDFRTILHFPDVINESYLQLHFSEQICVPRLYSLYTNNVEGQDIPEIDYTYLHS